MQSIQLETVQSAWLLFKNNLTEIGLKIGSAFLPALNSIISPLRGIVQGINELSLAAPSAVDVIVKLVGSLVGIVTTLILIKNIIGPFLISILGLQTGFEAVKKSIQGFSFLSLIKGWNLVFLAIGSVLTIIGLVIEKQNEYTKAQVDLYRTSSNNLAVLS